MCYEKFMNKTYKYWLVSILIVLKFKKKIIKQKYTPNYPYLCIPSRNVSVLIGNVSFG